MKKLFAMTAIASAIFLVGCDSGDVNINAQNNSTTDNSIGDGNVIGGGGTTTNNCASYSESGITYTGASEGVNCVYGADFVSLTNPLETSPSAPVTFKKLANSGVHIFRDSLVVGRNYDNDADMVAAGISEGGDGAIIQIEAGATLAFQSSEDYMVINRGSQIFAEGAVNDPITITSVSDAVNGTVGPEDVQEWGGMIINGFGVTNKCAYTGTFDAGNLATSDCHVAAEGKAGAGQTHYGGDNNADSSGVLRYFIVKHTGAQVAEDNELNGIAFDAVGSGTVVDYLQAYSTYDDGIEMFGGAVNISHYIALYVRDDSIDVDEGYRGTIDYALVIQSETDGNRCVESDGIGSYSSRTDIQDVIDQGINSRATIKNLTCIFSPTELTGEPNGTGTHDPGQGLRIREAHFPVIQNALVTSAYMGDVKLGDDDYNYCIRIDDEGVDEFLNGTDLVVTSSIFACQDLVDGSVSAADYTAAGNDMFQTLENGEDPTAASNAQLEILDGFYSIPLANMVVGGAAPTVTPVGSSYIGAVTKDDDWTAGWAYGLDPTNRGQALWFE